jgi:hypothetical protein
MRSNIATRILAAHNRCVDPLVIARGADDFGGEFGADEPETGAMDFGDDYFEDEFGLDLGGLAKALTGTLQQAGATAGKVQSTTQDISKVAVDVDTTLKMVNKAAPIVDWIAKYKVPLLVAGGVLVIASGVSTAVLVKVVFLA